jgi:hypothetical protein
MHFSFIHFQTPFFMLNKAICLDIFYLFSNVVELTYQGQTKGYKIGICCFDAKHAALRRKSKDWLARNQDNVSEWGDMSIRGLWSKIQLSVLI